MCVLIRGNIMRNILYARPTLSALIGSSPNLTSPRITSPHLELKKVHGRSPNQKCRLIMSPKVCKLLQTITKIIFIFRRKECSPKATFSNKCCSKRFPTHPKCSPDKVQGENVPKKVKFSQSYKMFPSHCLLFLLVLSYSARKW